MNAWLPGFYTVPQGHLAIVERFGKHVRVIQPGLHWINPLTESIKSFGEWNGKAIKHDCLIEMTEQLWKFNNIRCFTKDHVNVNAGVAMRFKFNVVENNPNDTPESPIDRVIRAVKRAVYKVDVLPDSLEDICSKALRTQIGLYGLDDLYLKQRQISNGVVKEIGETVKRWGVQLIGVQVENLEFDSKISSAMQQRRIAEAEQAKVKIEAETSRIQTENEAHNLMVRTKAEADQDRIKNQTEAEYIRELTECLGSKQAVQLLTAEKIADGFSAVAASPNTKTIMIPSEYKGMLKLVQEKAS